MIAVRQVSILVALSTGLMGLTSTHADPVPLATVVEHLARQGDAVLFSTDVVQPDTLVNLRDMSLAALERSLQELGLTLLAIQDQWVIVPAPPADHSQLRIRSRNGLPLEHVEAEWRGHRYLLQTVGEGLYRLPIAPGESVTVRADNHRPSVARLTSGSPELLLAPLELVENIIVTGTRHRLSGQSVTGSHMTLSADDLATAPSLADDSLRAVAQLPGMSSVGVSAKPRIRGGLSDELLVRVDGIELLDGYHLADFQNVFSVIDDRAVEAVDVYTGGFPARYGNRMSGVVEITTGRPAEEPRTQLGISLFALLANSHGSLDDGRAEYLASIRRGNLDQVLRQVDPDLGRPKYHDAFGRIGRRVSDTARVEAGLFVTKDDVTLQEDETSARSLVDSRFLWSRLHLDPGGGVESTSMLTYTWSRRRKRLNDLDDDSGAGGFLDHRLALWKLHGRTDVRVRHGDVRMELGIEAEYGSSQYDSVASINRGLIGAVLGSPEHSHDIHIDPAGWAGGAYWAGEFPLTPTLSVQPGIRWDFQEFHPSGSTRHVSPRLGLRFRPSELLTLRLDAGRFHQPEALHELQAADGETRFFRPQNVDHYIVGLEWLPSVGWELSAEAYQKRYRRVKQRYENLFNPFVLVPELEPDRVALDPDRARARGFDVALRYNFSERATAGVHYGYMDAEDHIEDDWVPRRWSQRHTISGNIAWQGQRWTVAAALTWHSGWRGADLPESVETGTVLPLTDVLSHVELKDFVSLDVSVRRTWRLSRSQLTAFASVTNLTDRDNVAGIDYDAELHDGLIVFEREREMLLPLVPSVGLLVAF